MTAPDLPYIPRRAHRAVPRPPRAWAERMYNVTRWTPMPAGGHFAAMEEPAALVDEIRTFFRPVR